MDMLTCCVCVCFCAPLSLWLLLRRYAFGECYFDCSKDQAEELLEEQKEKVAEEVTVLEKEMSNVRGTLADLKAALYGRFGKNINLEE